jgi:hypothetical protein
MNRSREIGVDEGIGVWFRKGVANCVSTLAYFPMASKPSLLGAAFDSINPSAIHFVWSPDPEQVTAACQLSEILLAELVRRGEKYLDPAGIFAGIGPIGCELVPRIATPEPFWPN